MDDKTKLKKIIDLSNDPEMALLNATEEVGVKVDNSTQSIKEAITEAVASIEIPIPKDESETLNLILEEVKKKPDLEEVISTVYDEVIANLPEVTDGKDGRDGVDGKEGLQGKQGERGFDGEDGLDGKNGSPDEPEEIRDKLETLKGQDRLDKKAIKGLDKMIEQDTLDRAVSILDQRTSFLINKVSNLQTSVSNIPSGVTSVSSSDSSLTVSPTTGAVNAIINTAHANSWTALQTITKTGSILQLGRTATLKWSAVVNTAGRIVWNAVGGDETDPYFQVPIIYASAGYFQSSTGQPTTGVGASFFETGITNGESFGSGEKIATFRISTSTYNYANGSYTHVAGTRATFTDPVTVPDDPYSASWDGNTDVPTKNAVYDKIQALGGGYQVPTGTVDGSNQVFTFTVAPNVIVVDQGRTMQKTSSDGNPNWTGTTTITLQVAPNFDLFAIA